MKLKEDTPVRGVDDVVAGDYLQTEDGQWHRIDQFIRPEVPAGKRERPSRWIFVTEGRNYGIFDVKRYAKPEDFEE